MKVISVDDLNNYYCATGNGDKSNRSLDNEYLYEYLVGDMGVEELHIECDEENEVSYLIIKNNELFQYGQGFAVVFIINHLCNGSVRFEDNRNENGDLGFEFE